MYVVQVRKLRLLRVSVLQVLLRQVRLLRVSVPQVRLLRVRVVSVPVVSAWVEEASRILSSRILYL